MPLENLRELRGYRRLYATTNLLVLCTFLIWAYFAIDLQRNAAPAVVVAAWALFTLAWHGLLPDQRFAQRMLFYGNLVDIAFTTALVWFSGGEASPFFFIYILVILSAALTLGLRPCFALAALASGLYLLVSSFALGQLAVVPEQVRQSAVRLAADGTVPVPVAGTGDLVAWSYVVGQALLSGLSRVWANLAALWLTAYVAGFFAQESARVRHSIQEAREKVEGFSRIDWLTGLYNRRHFHFLLSQEVSRADRYGRSLSLLLMDSDNLKLVNDTYGHPAGDHLLSTLAGLLRTETRLSDTVVRYGGDEFVVLLPDTDPVGARFLAERLRAAVEHVDFEWEHRPLEISVTIGIASLPQDANDGASLVARADAALYAGKRAGRNRVVTYPEAQAAERAQTAVLAGELLAQEVE